jgi:hypothetical protein
MTHRPGRLRTGTRALRLAAVTTLALASTLVGPDASEATTCVTSDEPPLPILLSPVTQPLPAESALVVEYRASDPLPAFELRRGPQRIPMTAETLAPGLFRLRPSQPPAPGSWELHAPARQHIQIPAVIGNGQLTPAEKKPLPLTIELTGTPLPPAAGAPSLEKMVLEVLRRDHGRLRVYASLSAPVPPDTVAVIGMWPAQDRRGGPPATATARALTRDGTHALVHDSLDHACTPPPPGFVHPYGGALARVALVNRFGGVIPLVGERPLELVDLSSPDSAPQAPSGQSPQPPQPGGATEPPALAVPPDNPDNPDDNPILVEDDTHEQPPDFGHVNQADIGCDPYVVSHPAQRIGLGVEVGTGHLQSAPPLDHLALGLGVSTERMLRKRLLLGMRMTYLTSGDESRDEDADGRDDQDTGNIHLVSFTVGPKLRRWGPLRQQDPDAWDLGLAAGYVQALTEVGASGPVAEIELRHTWSSIVSLGVRATQGFADAQDYRAILASAWLGVISKPERSWGAGCGFVENDDGKDTFAYGLGVHLPLVGHGVISDVGLMPPGLGLSLAMQVRYPVDVLLRGDFLWFLRQERDRLAMHTLLAGVRLARARTSALGFTALAGYGIAYRPRPGNIASGPVVDLGVSWDFAREAKGGLYLGMHGRFGVSPDNNELRAIFLSAGLEARSNAYKW